MDILLSINRVLLRVSTLTDAGDRSVDKADKPCYIQRKEADVSRQVNKQETKCYITVRALREIKEGDQIVTME